jgi:effector-binding domain-containing protein
MNKIKYVSVFILVGLTVWYLFIKPNDYVITFKSNTSPGTLFKGVEDWNLANQKSDSFNFTVINKKHFEFYTEHIEIDSLLLQVKWNFKGINDSVSMVKVGLLEREHSLYNRITAPFFNTKFKEKSIQLIQDFKNGLDFQLKNKFKVKIVGIDTLPELQYAYIKIDSVPLKLKAKKMLENNTNLLTFLTKHNLKEGKFPFLLVEAWNLEEDIISFRYCFPILKKDSLPLNEIIKYDKIKPKPALKAIYNGNYRTSDRSWFGLYQYAKKHQIKIAEPIEFFYNNPFNGGDELKWVSETYMSILE